MNGAMSIPVEEKRVSKAVVPKPIRVQIYKKGVRNNPNAKQKY